MNNQKYIDCKKYMDYGNDTTACWTINTPLDDVREEFSAANKITDEELALEKEILEA